MRNFNRPGFTNTNQANTNNNQNTNNPRFYNSRTQNVPNTVNNHDQGNTQYQKYSRRQIIFNTNTHTNTNTNSNTNHSQPGNFIEGYYQRREQTSNQNNNNNNDNNNYNQPTNNQYNQNNHTNDTNYTFTRGQQLNDNHNQNYNNNTIQYQYQDHHHHQHQHQYEDQTSNHNTNTNPQYQRNNKRSPLNKRIEFFSYKVLNDLNYKSPNEIVDFFYTKDTLNLSIKETKFTEDTIIIMISLLSKIIQVNSTNAREIISTIIQNTSFLQKTLIEYLDSLSFDLESTNFLTFLNDLISFCIQIFDKFSELSKELPIYKINKLVELLTLPQEIIYYGTVKPLKESIIKNNQALQLRETEEFAKRFLKKKTEKEQNIADIPIDYLKATLELTKEDFAKNIQPKLAQHLKVGDYKTWERYINTLFYLEKEDCYRSLRNSIHRIMGQTIDLRRIEKENRDIYYYQKVEIVAIEITGNGIFIILDFEPIRANISFTKRMIFGSLLILSDMEFSDCLFTTVHENPYLRNKIQNSKTSLIKHLPSEKSGRFRIAVSLVTISQESFHLLLKNRNRNLQMFESKAYFESYVHILKRLQDITIKDLPFEDVIIKGDFKQMRPDYLYEHSLLTYNDNEAIDLIRDKWPLSLKEMLDSSQFEALKVAMANKVALIQGPPGTGKTHVGALLTKILLQNTYNGSPILIVCFTNHALDQFLEHILDYTTQLIRIGGRCASERLQEYNINKQKKSRDRSFYSTRDKMEEIAEKLTELTEAMNKKKKLNSHKMHNYFPRIYDKIERDFYSKTELTYTINKSKEELYKFWIEFISFDDIYYQFFQDEQEYYEYYYNLFNQFYSNDTAINYPRQHQPQNNPNENPIANNEANNEDIDDFDEDEINENLDRMAEVNRDDDDDDNDEEDNKNNADYHYYQNKQKQQMIDYDIEGEKDLTGNNLIYYTEEQFNFIIDHYNLWDLGSNIRENLMRYMKHKLIDYIHVDLSQLKRYKELYEKKRGIELMSDSVIIRSAKVVGMTTTGASKYATILEQTKFEIVIIEEAAEVLESHIATLLTQHTKHLIMIGDHKQLRPKPYNYEISKKYNFDISMFERLINNKIPFGALKYQRRMKPIFADFVRIIYKDGYEDHVTTTKKDFAKGFLTDMHIFSHTFPEKEDMNLASKSNDFEAKYVIKLAKYIMQQGYKEEQITIITFYVGQVLLIRKLAREVDIKPRIVSVDNYQGEENDFVLLSLVRSNKMHQIGFLKTFNRVCVAFSRAKIGFYIVGNLDCLIQGEYQSKNPDDQMKDVWKKIKELAEEKKIIGKTIALACQKHKRQTIIESIADFAKIPEGGCQEPCKERLLCGHVCELLCHSYTHDTIKCYKSCEKIFADCHHKCTKLCYQDCNKCLVKVDRILPCNHRGNYYCSENMQQVKCHAKCQKKLSCGHKCKKECHEICSDFKCYETVTKTLPCGHTGEYDCHLPLDKCLCKTKCNTLLQPCEHVCEGTCGKCLNKTLHVSCKVKCNRQLICGHLCKNQCAQPCFCKDNCGNVCSHGFCNMKCCEVCINCMEKCSNQCIHHQCSKKCWEECNVPTCNEPCKLRLKCGHQCLGLCGYICPDVCKTCQPEAECFEVFFGHEDDEDGRYYQLSKCKHIFEVRDLDHYIEELKKKNNVQMPACPRCKTLMINERRYLNQFKETLLLVQKVKDKYLGYVRKEEYIAKGREIVMKVLSMIRMRDYNCSNSNASRLQEISLMINKSYMEKSDFIDFPKSITENVMISYNLCKAYLGLEKKQSSMITTYKLLMLLERFVSIEYYANTTAQGNNDNGAVLFLIHYNQLQQYFRSFSEFTEAFFKQLQLKVDTMNIYSKGDKIPSELREMMIKDSFSSEKAREIYKNDFFIQYKDEAEEILRGLGTQWYTCPNGHFYVIANCGGPVINARCPECNAVIGGSGHVSAQGNTGVYYRAGQGFRPQHNPR